MKDRINSFDDCFPCRRRRRKKKSGKLKHVKNWLKLFVVDYHNKEALNEQSLLFKLNL